MLRRTRSAVASGLAAACVCAACVGGGCASGGGGVAAGVPAATVASTAAPPAARAQPGDGAAKSEAAVNESALRAAARPVRPPTVYEAPPETPTEGDAASAEPEAKANTAAASTPAAAPPPAQGRAELTRLLAAELTPERATHASGDAFRTALAAAALSGLDAEAAGPAVQAWEGRLTPAQRKTLAAARGVYAGLPGAAGDGAESGPVAALLRAQADVLEPAAGLAVGHAALCTRVEGYGRYSEVGSSALLAGRAHPVIVYVEPTGFEHRSVEGGGEPRWAVELSQELHLYHDADGTLAWMDREQSVSEVSRRQRRDFYLVRRVELPATLSIGAYRLKVIVRDRVSGATAEAIVPLSVVADAGLAGVGGR